MYSLISKENGDTLTENIVHFLPCFMTYIWYNGCVKLVQCFLRFSVYQPLNGYNKMSVHVVEVWGVGVATSENVPLHPASSQHAQIGGLISLHCSLENTLVAWLSKDNVDAQVDLRIH